VEVSRRPNDAAQTNLLQSSTKFNFSLLKRQM